MPRDSLSHKLFPQHLHTYRSHAMVVVTALALAPSVSSPIARDPAFAVPTQGILVDKPSKKQPRDNASRDTSAQPSTQASAQTLLTYGSLVSLHHNEVLVLSDTEPSRENWSHLLRDRVTGQATQMDEKLLGLVRTIAKRLNEQRTTELEKPQRSSGSAPREWSGRVEFVSGYRSWKLNEMLRKKGRNVASESQHTLGKAIDMRFDGLDPKQLVEVVEDLKWNGGIGYYPGTTDKFVHVDTGANRRWRGR